MNAKEIRERLRDDAGRFKHGSLKRIAEWSNVDYHVVANLLNERKIAIKDPIIKTKVYSSAKRYVELMDHVKKLEA